MMGKGEAWGHMNSLHINVYDISEIEFRSLATGFLNGASPVHVEAQTDFNVPFHICEALLGQECFGLNESIAFNTTPLRLC